MNGWLNPLRWLFCALLLLPLTLSANTLSHSRWQIDDHLSGCLPQVYFGVSRYLIIDHCIAPTADGVIERGLYRYTGKTLILDNRLPTVPPKRLPIPLSINRFEITDSSPDRLVLEAEEMGWVLLRISPNLPAKPI